MTAICSCGIWRTAPTDAHDYECPVTAAADALVAAADVANGAMVALVLSDADLQRLAIEGGEPLDQLHLTLVYLGDADQIDEPTRQALIDAGQATAVGWNGVAAEAFAPALFNSTGDEPCAVLICSGAELAEFYETIAADVTELVDLPDDIHAPFCAHVTLMYYASVVDGHVISQDGATSTDLTALIERCGPVMFDKLRFAFGGEITDIPLAPVAMPDDATVDETPADSVSPAPSELEPSTVASARIAFDGCLRCFGPSHPGDCPPAL